MLNNVPNVVHTSAEPMPATAGHVPLLTAVEGPVLLPDDIGYGEECRTFNLSRALTPAVVVGATHTDDVAAAVRHAGRLGMPVAVRNQGHQVVLPTAEDALLITTNRLQEISVDPGRRTVRVGAGVTCGPRCSPRRTRPDWHPSSGPRRTSASSVTRWAAD
ncbi:FAD-binding protein [Streptomyces canarius]